MVIKQLFTFITGISEDMDSDDSQEAWDRQRDLDENDLDGDEPNDDDDFDSELQELKWITKHS